MAVVLGNPIVVTEAIAASTPIATGGSGIWINFIKWHKPTTIGHLLSLLDSKGKVIAVAECEVANKSQYLPIFAHYPDIYCDDMDSGALYIYS